MQNIFNITGKPCSRALSGMHIGQRSAPEAPPSMSPGLGAAVSPSPDLAGPDQKRSKRAKRQLRGHKLFAAFRAFTKDAWEVPRVCR